MPTGKGFASVAELVATMDAAVITAYLGQLEAELAKTEKAFQRSVLDEYDSEDRIRRAALTVLPAIAVEGDSCGVPPVADVVERMAREFAALKSAGERLAEATMARCCSVCDGEIDGIADGSCDNCCDINQALADWRQAREEK